eukprot:2080729-Alexandrium_andersonii.AAC.1
MGGWPLNSPSGLAKLGLARCTMARATCTSSTAPFAVANERCASARAVSNIFCNPAPGFCIPAPGRAKRLMQRRGRLLGTKLAPRQA